MESKRTTRTVAALTLGLIGLVGWVSVSHSMALFDASVIAGAVGLTTFGTIRIVDGRLIDAVRVELADGAMVVDLFTGVPSQAVPMFTTPSLVLMGLGVVFIVTGLAVRADLISIADVLGQPSDTRPDVEFNETVRSDETGRANGAVEPNETVRSNEMGGPTETVDEADPWEGGVTIGGTNDTRHEPTVTDQESTVTDDVQEYNETDYDGVTISQPDETDNEGVTISRPHDPDENGDDRS